MIHNGLFFIPIAAFGALANAVHAQTPAQSRNPRCEPEMGQWLFAHKRKL